MNILDLKPATYVYDFQVTDSLGNVTTYFKGSILIVQDITQLTITKFNNGYNICYSRSNRHARYIAGK
jgi:hypothetical protein